MTPHRPPRVLFVSYLFPPTGGVGVHRVTKFVKYLPQAGWDSSVLTVSNPSVPLQDESLLKDIPAGTIIRRVRTYEPGYAVKNAVSGGQKGKSNGNVLLRSLKSLARNTANLLLQPDAQILWHPQAFQAGLKLLAEVPHDAIIATGPPFSSLILGARLSRRTGLPLILDYRDEWDISNAYWENKGQGRFANWIQSRQQRFAVKQASVLLATTPSSAAAVESFARKCGSHAEATFIYNGFDPDDYPPQTPAVPTSTPRRFRLSFIGTLWNLNSIQPVVNALLLLSQRSPELASEIELLVAGRRTPDQESILDELQNSPIQVTRLPFVSHAEAIELMRSSDALLMINSDLPKTQRIINAKTFEYMAARRPMLVVAPRGDVWDVVRDLPGTMLCPPADIEGIAEKLALAVERYRCGTDDRDAIWEIRQFERKQLAAQLASLLNRTTLQHNLQPTFTAEDSDHGISERYSPEC
ncbi:glycosyltransferase family 4 protein [Planctomicrobium sp. SH661]|uniref:glycosyltransferase family 4 protein n=1 Tax=Planctomicrobium sp. SH661 TaxID=3448124 RepID=UPI003F5C7D38